MDVTDEEWAKMGMVYRKAERQTRVISELQQVFESDMEYVANNGIGGDNDGVGEEARRSSKPRHVNRKKAYMPQGKRKTSRYPTSFCHDEETY